jgi:hypothetical protein
MSDRIVVGKLTDEQVKIYKRSEVCMKACEAVVEKVIGHWEEYEMMKDALWVNIKKDCEAQMKELNLSGGSFRLELNSGEVYFEKGESKLKKKAMATEYKTERLNKDWRAASAEKMKTNHPNIR